MSIPGSLGATSWLESAAGRGHDSIHDVDLFDPLTPFHRLTDGP